MAIAAMAEQAELSGQDRIDAGVGAAPVAMEPTLNGALQGDVPIFGGITSNRPIEAAKTRYRPVVSATEGFLGVDELLKIASKSAVEIGLHRGSGSETSRSRFVATRAYTESDLGSAWPKMSLTILGGAAISTSRVAWQRRITCVPSGRAEIPTERA
jgi:hypothetical protein